MGGGRLLVGVCAALMAVAVVNVAAREAATATSVVVGFAKCAHCSRKKMKPEAAFKRLHVAIKCKNGHGKYERMAVGDLDVSGAFSVPLAADLRGADCFAQLHRVGRGPCPGQEPSKILPLSEGTFVAVAGKTHYPSAQCASAIMCYPCRKRHLYAPYPRRPVLIHRQWMPMPEYQPPTPVYGQPAPEDGAPAPEDGTPLFGRRYHRRHDLARRLKKPVLEFPPFVPIHWPPITVYWPPIPFYPAPAPEYGPPPMPVSPAPAPEYGPTPMPVSPAPAPEFGPPPMSVSPAPAPQYGPPPMPVFPVLSTFLTSFKKFIEP